MSAHCNRCGFDLPYEGPCSYCTVVAERDLALSQLHLARQALEEARTALEGVDARDRCFAMTRVWADRLSVSFGGTPPEPMTKPSAAAWRAAHDSLDAIDGHAWAGATRGEVVNLVLGAAYETDFGGGQDNQEEGEE